MQRVTLIRGQTGVVLWTVRRTGVDELSWECLRDKFRVIVPQNQAGLEAFLTTIAQHSTTLVGTIAQVVQLEI